MSGTMTSTDREVNNMAEGGKIKVDIVERMESAIKQRTCLWESDIKLAIEEILDLRAELQQYKDNAHIKKLNKNKEVE